VPTAAGPLRAPGLPEDHSTRQRPGVQRTAIAQRILDEKRGLAHGQPRSKPASALLLVPQPAVDGRGQRPARDPQPQLTEENRNVIASSATGSPSFCWVGLHYRVVRRVPANVGAARSSP
jgi:hypothetical protein